MAKSKSQRKPHKLLITIIVLLGVAMYSYAQWWIVGTIDRNTRLQEEINDMKKEKFLFEAAFTKIIPDALSHELAPYGKDFYQEHTKGYVSGYEMIRVYRARNISQEEIESLLTTQFEKTGYKNNPESIGDWVSEEGVKVDYLLIPFEDKGYIDIKVSMYRSVPFDWNRKFIEEIRTYKFE